MTSEAIKDTDLPEITGLYIEVFKGHPWNKKWSYDSASSRLGSIMATLGFIGIMTTISTSIVAFVMGYCEPFDEGIDFYVKEMCVTPSLQHQGIGT
jgi:aminoglycoside 6'-N-acetyltransferase I